MNRARYSPGGVARGRKPRFMPSDVLTMAILRDNGWTYDRLAAEYRTSRSVVMRYLACFTPGRWAA
jgi:hypothetical protein